MPRSKRPVDDGQAGESPDDQKDQRYQRNPRQSEPGPREMLRTEIGKVVGGIEAARRFEDLLAKTLRLQQ